MHAAEPEVLIIIEIPIKVIVTEVKEVAVVDDEFQSRVTSHQSGVALVVSVIDVAVSVVVSTALVRHVLLRHASAEQALFVLLFGLKFNQALLDLAVQCGVHTDLAPTITRNDDVLALLTPLRDVSDLLESAKQLGDVLGAVGVVPGSVTLVAVFRHLVSGQTGLSSDALTQLSSGRMLVVALKALGREDQGTDDDVVHTVVGRFLLGQFRLNFVVSQLLGDVRKALVQIGGFPTGHPFEVVDGAIVRQLSGGQLGRFLQAVHEGVSVDFASAGVLEADFDVLRVAFVCVTLLLAATAATDDENSNCADDDDKNDQHDGTRDQTVSFLGLIVLIMLGLEIAIRVRSVTPSVAVRILDLGVSTSLGSTVRSHFVSGIGHKFSTNKNYTFDAFLRKSY
jgi:hypothetical protein